MASGQLDKFIFLECRGQTSRRTLLLLSVNEHSVKAYCLSRHHIASLK